MGLSEIIEKPSVKRGERSEPKVGPQGTVMLKDKEEEQEPEKGPEGKPESMVF